MTKRQSTGDVKRSLGDAGTSVSHPMARGINKQQGQYERRTDSFKSSIAHPGQVV